MVQNRQTMMERARIGAGATLFLRSKHGKAIIDQAGLNDAAEIVVIPACASEPAVITLHRLEKQDTKQIFLATEIDGVGEAVLLTAVPRNSNPQYQNVDLKGGMTTGEWMIQMRNSSENTTYSADGTEFKTAIDALSTFETVGA